MDEKLNLLIIEDSEDDAHLLIRKLKKEGYRPDYKIIDNAPDMETALDNGKWDIIIADYSMPGFSGLNALKILKEKKLDIPFIIVSGIIGEDIAVEAMKAGAHDYIMKKNLKRLFPAIKRELHEVRLKKKAEEALRKSEERLKLAMDATSDGIWDWNIKTGEVYFSPRCYTMVGYEEDEIQPSPSSWLSYVHSSDKNSVIEIVQKLCRGEIENFEEEIRLKTKSETWKWILTRGKIVKKDSNNKPLRAAGTHIDITYRKEAEEALKESEGRNRALLSAIPDLMFLFSKDGVYLDYNAPDSRLLLGTTEDIINRNIKDILPEEIGDKAISLFKKTLETGKMQILEYSLSISGKIRYFEGRIVACDKDKVLSIVRDITEQKTAEEARRKLEDQLQQAQKLESLGVLAGGIAHDFNNILTSILGYADLALTELQENSIEKESVQQIASSAHRAADLTKQMLAYSGKGKFFVKSINLNKLIKETVKDLDRRNLENCKIIYRLKDGLPVIEGDKAQLRQVIKNLIINGAEAITNSGGEIIIETGIIDCNRSYLSKHYLDDKLPEGSYVYLNVKDNGSGMTDEIKEKIFDPFFSTKFTGRGLGLAAVLGIVRGHHGAIKVSSMLNKGTNFNIIFPATNKKKDNYRKPEQPGKKIIDRVKTILIIDDDISVCKVTENILKKLGFNVMVAFNGLEGIEVFKKNIEKINTVLLDMKMPYMDGEETLCNLRKIDKNLPVIMSSGYKEEYLKTSLEDRGLTSFIQKPYRVKDLMQTISKALAAKQ